MTAASDTGTQLTLDDYEELFETALDLMCVAGVDGYLKRLNPPWTRLLGFSAAELTAEPFVNFIHPEDRAGAMAAFASAIQGKTFLNFTCRYRCKDGSFRTLEWTCPPPKRDLFFAVARDVTERDRHQARLDHLYQAGRVVLYNAKARDDYAVTYMSENVVDHLGFTAAEFTGQPDLWVSRLHPDDAGRVLADLENIIEDGHQVHQYRFRHKDGTFRWMYDDCKVVRSSTGQALELIGFWQDITERKATEDLIRKQASALTELSTPIIPISDEVLVMPLIGTMDSQRATQVLDTLLTGVSERRAETAILDITGVSVVDTQVANALLQAAKAVRLLGAKVVLTGIRPEVARTLVGLGVDLADIVTRSTLQAGIAYAMEHTGEGADS
jgi:rsbT co-antagonist protein RsbR